MISLNNNLINSTLKRREVLIFLKQIRKASKFKVSDPREKALKHFDDFYKALFVDRWPSIRLGLLSRQKYVAVLNNFADVKKTEEFLEREGAFDLVNFIQVQKPYQESEESDVIKRNGKSAGDKAPLEEIILGQAQAEEIKELKLHPEGREFKTNVDNLNEEDEKKDAKDVLYMPEDARTSLHEDLLSSQIDQSRLIEPGSLNEQSGLQEFVPATLLRGLESYVPESEYYKYYQIHTSIPITVEKEHSFEFPEKLKVYTFDRGDISEFPEPFRDGQDVHTYLKVEGSELLTALVLGVQPEDKVLDMCSLSGSTPYCIFQTLCPKVLVCATNGHPQTENVFRNHLYDYQPFWREMLVVTDDKLTEFDEMFDKILINVPSTEDKRSVLEMEKNIFHALKLRQRLRLPEYQCTLLLKALKMVRPGGTIVYCTSTLSPVQNEGVVSAALKTAWEENKMEFIVKDLTPALKHISYFYNFEECLDIKYGTLVVPFAPVNFGPKYFCKLVRKE